MSQFTLTHLTHIRNIVDAHLRSHQNDFQSVKDHPESPFHSNTKLEIERTQSTLRAVDDVLYEYRMRSVK